MPISYQDFAPLSTPSVLTARALSVTAISSSFKIAALIAAFFLPVSFWLGVLLIAALIAAFPAVGRPVGMRIVDQLGSDGQGASPQQLIGITLKIPKLQAALAPAIMALGSDKLTTVLTTASDLNVRRQSAAYLGTLAAQGDKSIGKAVAKVFAFDADASDGRAVA